MHSQCGVLPTADEHAAILAFSLPFTDEVYDQVITYYKCLY